MYFRTHNLKVGTHGYSNMMKIARFSAKVVGKRPKAPPNSPIETTSRQEQCSTEEDYKCEHPASLFRCPGVVYHVLPDKIYHKGDVKPNKEGLNTEESVEVDNARRRSLGQGIDINCK